MYRNRRCVSLLLVVILIAMLPVSASAAVVNKITDHYGALRGTANQSGRYLNTTTSVTSNDYHGVLYTKIQISDGLNTVIQHPTYSSNIGDKSLSNSTWMQTLQKSAIVPAYASVTHEIRGGTQPGDYKQQNVYIDSSAF